MQEQNSLCQTREAFDQFLVVVSKCPREGDCYLSSAARFCGGTKLNEISKLLFVALRSIHKFHTFSSFLRLHTIETLRIVRRAVVGELDHSARGRVGAQILPLRQVRGCLNDVAAALEPAGRSEERRGGKECRSR